MAEFLDALELYDKVYQLGQKDYHAHAARGENGHLPCLDDRMDQCDILAYIKQPTQEIPINRIAGTYTASRAASFSANFLPLQRRRTEFATKWANLCLAHLNDGITDPITVYEYLWRYYVIEGNKRTSVMKSMGALDLEADITRVIPERSDAPEIIANFEYCDFTRFTD